MNGLEQMRAKLKQIAKSTPEKVASALYKEAQIEMTESKRRVPVDTGVLRASGFVAEPVYEGTQISVALNYGGAAESYAIIVHEDLHAFHKIGQAKYLESVLNESRPYMAARLQARLNLNKTL